MTLATEVFLAGTSRLAERRIREALPLFDQAQQLGYDCNDCAAARWQCWMLTGEFERAWAEGDALIARGAPDEHRLWDGLPFTGKRVIIRCLHGYGDAIQFLRYAPLVRAVASHVTVETHPEMVSLVRGFPGVDNVISWADKNRVEGLSWNQQIEVMELPRAFRTSLATIPAEVPYISPKPRPGGPVPECVLPRIGLVWAASSWNPLRSIFLAELSPLLAMDGLSFYSFQRGPQRAELEASPHRNRIHDTAEHSPQISDTASDLLNIDLLITVDTMIAHLAGALGRKVWTLLPFEADWRWMIDCDHTPWYPTMKLFRQPQRESGWAPVVDRLCREVSDLFLRMRQAPVEPASAKNLPKLTRTNTGAVLDPR
jgi:hypothetical protein